MAFKEIPLRNSDNDDRVEIHCLSVASLDFILPNSLNFRNLFTALDFLLRFWAKPKMKSPTGLRSILKQKTHRIQNSGGTPSEEAGGYFAKLQLTPMYTSLP